MYCVVCGNQLFTKPGSSDTFFVCEADIPQPMRVVEKNFCNTCGKVRTDEGREFTQCPSCYQRWVESQARESELRTRIRLGEIEDI
jgi:hypothetical protein